MIFSSCQNKFVQFNVDFLFQMHYRVSGGSAPLMLRPYGAI